MAIIIICSFLTTESRPLCVYPFLPQICQKHYCYRCLPHLPWLWSLVAKNHCMLHPCCVSPPLSVLRQCPGVGIENRGRSQKGHQQRRLRANFEKKSETLLNLDSMSPRRSWVKTIRITIAPMQTLRRNLDPVSFHVIPPQVHSISG